MTTGTYEYKVTRGGWETVECKVGGQQIPNRILEVREADLVQEIYIGSWIDLYPTTPKISTASKNVQIIDTAFRIPQLKRTRKIWIYLPADYHRSGKKYPVLYMHDAQNIFDDATAFSGEWGVDDFLDSTTVANCIVVGIENSSAKRLNEYNPYDHARFGKAEGDEYVDFLVRALKPFVDKNYRTKKAKESTFVAGSSMGGLISMYAILKYPKVFGGAGVFSPSFAIGSGIFKDIQKRGKKIKGKIYFYAGKHEGDKMVPDILKAFEKMSQVSKAKMITVIRDEGKHDEATWRVEFPLFYNWLMRD